MSYRGGRGGRGGGGGRGKGAWQNNGSKGGPAAKKPRQDDDDEDMETFEDRLAGMLDEEEAMMLNDQDVPMEVEESLNCQQDRFLRWRRPEAPKLDVGKVSFLSNSLVAYENAHWSFYSQGYIDFSTNRY